MRYDLLRRSGTIYSDATVLFHPTQRYDFADVITIQTIIDRNYDLDIKNPNKKVEEVEYDRKAIIEKLEKSFNEALVLLNELKAE